MVRTPPRIDLYHHMPTSPPADSIEPQHEARLWRDKGWLAKVVKNNDDDGWAVEMYLHGHAEPALVGPWTMGRDKKNPKPLDSAAFNTLVKTAAEVVRRHEQQTRAMLHKQMDVATETGKWSVTLDIVADEDDPHAWLAAEDEFQQPVARQRVSALFKLTQKSALAWVEGGFGKPASKD